MPPFSPFFGQKAFSGEGGGGAGVYLEAPRARNFVLPPSFIYPPPLEGSFQGGGGWGCSKIWPCILGLHQRGLSQMCSKERIAHYVWKGFERFARAMLYHLHTAHALDCEATIGRLAEIICSQWVWLSEWFCSN